MSRRIEPISKAVAGFFLLTEQSSHSQNDSTYTGLYRHTDGRRIRVYIRANSYDFQSAARAELWADDGWSLIWQIDPVSVQARHSLHSPAPATFQPDVRRLLDAVAMVLG